MALPPAPRKAGPRPRRKVQPKLPKGPAKPLRRPTQVKQKACTDRAAVHVPMTYRAAALVCAGMAPDNPDLTKLVAISQAESGGKLNALGDHGTSFGPWQEHTLQGKEQAACSLTAAGRLAVEKYRSQGLTAWSTYNNATYLPFMPRAMVAVRRMRAAFKGKQGTGLGKAGHGDVCKEVAAINVGMDVGSVYGGGGLGGLIGAPPPSTSEADCLKKAKTPAEAAKCAPTGCGDGCLSCVHLSVLGTHCTDQVIGGLKVAAGGTLLVISGLALLYVVTRAVPGGLQAQRAATSIATRPVRTAQRVTRSRRVARELSSRQEARAARTVRATPTQRELAAERRGAARGQSEGYFAAVKEYESGEMDARKAQAERTSIRRAAAQDRRAEKERRLGATPLRSRSRIAS